MPITASEVFTPNDYPTHTYVERGVKLEQLLRNAHATPKAVISISGPSKSGKTVLAERVIGKDNLIVVSGSEIEEAGNLWERVLDWMGAPSTVTEQSGDSSASELSGQASGDFGIPLVARGSGQVALREGGTVSSSTTTTVARYGLAQVVKEIADSDFVVLIDDFHYMPRPVQVEAAKQIKTAAERGVKILVASVPHRSDDVVRSNSELRGRTTNIDTSFWPINELKQIALVGFPKLNATITDEGATRLAREACGSPQIMQAICLQTCFHLDLRQESGAPITIEFSAADLGQILEVASLTSDYSSLVREMHRGPKIRGTERKEFTFTDGTKGDVYRCLLLAIAEHPPAMDLPYTKLMERVARVCTAGSSPVGSSVTEACKQIVKLARAMHSNQRIIDFDDEAGAGTLSIVDPYWLFYLRSSPKLEILAKGE